MFLRIFLILSFSALAACASVSNERTSTYTVDGQVYPLRTQTVTSGSRTFDTSSVRVRGMWFQCLPASPGSCEAAVRLAKQDRRVDF
ncbi:hypothetical protein [uncultured Roseobacter sp.]|uniref:hypothetical protein n=1 Tax=uncultured Roseobacter sp. TaxID=114847 RepID=UPI00260BDE9C|nr:hypothetical protein [uncultured Roseobacter sp.]